MYVGMKLDALQKEWLKHFASNISKRDIENKVVKTGGYIWHIFSFALVDSSNYLSGEEARSAFNKPQMALTRLLGAFKRDARMLPARVVIPMKPFTMPMVRWPASGFDSIMAGNAASYMDATRLMAARNSTAAVQNAAIASQLSMVFSCPSGR